MGSRVDPQNAVQIDNIFDDGFQVSGLFLKGPVIVVNGKVLLWDVPQYGVGSSTLSTEGAKVEGKGLFENWTAEMLKVFEVLENPPEILVFGTGREFSPLPNVLRQKLHSLGIMTEVQKTVGVVEESWNREKKEMSSVRAEQQ